MIEQEAICRVWLDGQPVPRADETTLTLKTLLVPGDPEMEVYQIPNGDKCLTVAIDKKSEVELFAKDLDNSLADDVNVLIVINSKIKGVKVSGDCTVIRAQLENVSMTWSLVAFAENWSTYSSNQLERVTLVKTELYDSIVGDEMTLINSHLVKSILSGPKGSNIRNLAMTDSSLMCTTPIVAVNCYLTECRIEAYDYLTIKGVNWSNVRLQAEDLIVENIFQLFKLELPYTVLYFYRTGPGTYSLGLHDIDYELPCDGYNFDNHLRDVILGGEDPAIKDELVRYVIGSINSRIQVLELMELKELEKRANLQGQEENGKGKS